LAQAHFWAAVCGWGAGAAAMGSGAGKHKSKYQPRVIHLTPKEPKADQRIVTAQPHQLEHAPTILTADVGGTNSRLHLFKPPARGSDGQGKAITRIPEDHLIRTTKYHNHKYDSFYDVIQEFLAECSLQQPPYIACFAVAGAVVDNTCQLVNLGWYLDGDALARDLGIHEVHLINDFEAQGYGILTLEKETECDVLQEAQPVAGAPMAVLGAGTGLGECFLAPGEHGDYEVWPTEGGHAEFAPRQDGSSKLQFEMCQYLLIKYSAKHRLSVERIVSGKGITNIYQFLAWKFPEKVCKDVHRRFCDGFDPAVIVESARMGTCELSDLTMEIFFSAYGSEAGCLALTYMPFGGLFVTGGVTNKVRDFLLGGKMGTFMDAFLDKGRVSPCLQRIPVYVVRGEDLGERGVKMKAMRMYSEAQLVRQRSKGHGWLMGASMSASPSM